MSRLGELKQYKKQKEATHEVSATLDMPSCEFIAKAKSDERVAIETYTGEAERTSDPIMERVFHSVAVEEMGHLEVLDDTEEKAGCKVKK